MISYCLETSYASGHISWQKFYPQNTIPRTQVGITDQALSPIIFMIMCRNNKVNMKWHILKCHHHNKGKTYLGSTSINKMEVKH